MKERIFLIVLLSCVLGFDAYAQNESLRFGASFPPSNNAQRRSLSQKYLKDLNVKLVRFGDDWVNRQSDPKTFKWKSIFDRLDWVKDNDYSLLLTIRAYAPNWACDPHKKAKKGCLPKDMRQFKQFIDTYLRGIKKRYGRLPDKIQFANEWAKEEWYPGTRRDFVIQANIVYDAVKEISPNTQVVLGGLARGQIRQVAFCKGKVDNYGKTNRKKFCREKKYREMERKMKYVFRRAKYDIVDQHLYFDVEHWPAYLDTLYKHLVPRKKRKLPLIISEFGGPDARKEPHDEEYHAKRVQQYIETILKSPAKEAYYFKLVEGGKASGIYGLSGLLSLERVLEGSSQPEKKAYYVFKRHSNQTNR